MSVKTGAGAAPPERRTSSILLAISLSPMIVSCGAQAAVSVRRLPANARRAMIRAAAGPRAPAPPLGRPRMPRDGSRKQAPRCGADRAMRAPPGSAAFPTTGSIPSPRAAATACSLISITECAVPCLQPLCPEIQIHVAVADQDVLKRRRLNSSPSAACGPGGLRAVLGAASMPLRRFEHERVQQDGDDRAGEDRVAALLRQKLERHSQAGKDERELLICAKLAAMVRGGLQRPPERAHDQKGGQRLADDDDGDRRQDGPGRLHQHARLRAASPPRRSSTAKASRKGTPPPPRAG